MNQTHFNRLAITQVTTPVIKKTKDSAKTLEPMATTSASLSNEAKVVPPPGGRQQNDSQLSNQGWKPTMTTQEILTVKNLF